MSKKNVDELCVDLALEVNRLAGCAVDHLELARTDPEAYVNVVNLHFLRLLIPIADIKRAAKRPSLLSRIASFFSKK